MLFFLDSAKLDEIKKAYELFRIDGITTNPRHIQASGQPFYKVIEDIAKWASNTGFKDYKDFPISVEVNPHLNDAKEMVLWLKI